MRMCIDGEGMVLERRGSVGMVGGCWGDVLVVGRLPRYGGDKRGMLASREDAGGDVFVVGRLLRRGGEKRVT